MGDLDADDSDGGGAQHQQPKGCGRAAALISPQVTLRLLQHLAPTETPTGAGPAVPLSDREIEVAKAIAKGLTNAEIAASLFISLSTVKSHLASMQNKLGVRNRVGIAAWAWGRKLA